MRLLTSLRDGLTALAYPATCQVCGATIDHYDDGVACADCWADPTATPPFGEPMCAKCGLPLQPRLADHPATGCGLCDALPFMARACGAYSGALEASIWFLKSHPHLCGRLRRLIGKTFRDHQAALAADVIIPVPLHRRRRRERGFNQAELIARVVARESGLPLALGLLIRTKPTDRHRAGLDAKDRARSVSKAFHVPRPQAVAGRSILLIDDLFTTGSTLASAAESLLGAGASRVSVLTIARVLTHAV